MFGMSMCVWKQNILLMGIDVQLFVLVVLSTVFSIPLLASDAPRGHALEKYTCDVLSTWTGAWSLTQILPVVPTALKSFPVLLLGAGLGTGGATVEQRISRRAFRLSWGLSLQLCHTSS